MRRKSDPKVSELLRGVSLFAGCSDKELAGIGKLLTEITMPSGRTLCTEGETGNEAYIIAEGEALVTLKGKELATLGPGAVVGEMSVIDQEPRSATVVAKTDMTLYVLEGREFWTMVSDSPLIARKLLKNLAQRLREVENAPIG